jgi:hypothetical protein
MLRQHPKFTKTNSDGTEGIMTPYPCCKTNEFVSFLCFDVQKWPRPPRHSVHADARRLHLCSMMQKCKNLNCAGPLPKPGSKLAKTLDVVPMKC